MEKFSAGLQECAAKVAGTRLVILVGRLRPSAQGRPPHRASAGLLLVQPGDNLRRRRRDAVLHLAPANLLPQEDGDTLLNHPLAGEDRWPPGVLLLAPAPSNRLPGRRQPNRFETRGFSSSGLLLTNKLNLITRKVGFGDS